MDHPVSADRQNFFKSPDTIQLLYGFEGNSISIAPQALFPEGKPREIVGVEGDNKNAISQKNIQ
jgi:hypothetical protein